MILEKQTQSQVLREGQADSSVKMSLDMESAQVLMQMLSKNLYSDAIGSTIREAASNALDSHRRAKTTDPIIVSLGRNKHNNIEFSVEDFGIGLDADDVKNIISKYGKSTKRDSNVELGMMGLGFKAPLAYSSSFTFVCRKNGIERKYMMYEGEEENTIDLLYTKPTTERNGVKVIISVNYSDKWEFRKKIKEQLAYFESVYLVLEDDPNLNNEFKIYRGKNIQKSSLSDTDKLHISLDNVYYPIDFSKLGIDIINCNMALKFGLSDGLFPTPNRESIRYTKEAKDIILKKIKKIATDVITSYNTTLTDSDDIKILFEYYNPYKNSTHDYIKTEDITITCDVEDFKKYSDVNIVKPQLSILNHLKFSDLYKKKHIWLYEYEIKYSFGNGRINKSTYSNFSADNLHPSTSFIYSGDMKASYKEYLRWFYNNNNSNTRYIYNGYKVLKKTKKRPLRSNTTNTFTATISPFSYYELLDLKHVKRKLWREYIKEFESFINFLLADIVDLNTFKFPQKFLDFKQAAKDAAKAKRLATIKANRGNTKKIKLKGDVYVKEGERLQKYTGNNCKFVPTKYNLETVPSLSNIFIYDKYSRQKNVDDLFHLSNKHKIKVLTTSDREYKILENANIHNLISYETFMKGKTKTFARIVTSSHIYNLIRKYDSFFSRVDMVSNVNKELGKKAKALIKYAKEHFPSHFKYNDDTLITSMQNIAEITRFYDYSIYDDYLYVKKELSNFNAHNVICHSIGYLGRDNHEQIMTDVYVDTMKYHKKRVNIKYYSKDRENSIINKINNKQK